MTDLVPELEEVYAEHVYVGLHPTNIGVKEVANHANETVECECKDVKEVQAGRTRCLA